MRVYLDNCCYNRPFDDQGDVCVHLETVAKLAVQLMMAVGVVEYAWSDILTHEVSQNPVMERRKLILSWKNGAVVDVVSDREVLEKGRTFQSMGIKPKDALHLASALKAGCDWLLTTDKGILKKVEEIEGMKVANPIDFIMAEGENG